MSNCLTGRFSQSLFLFLIAALFAGQLPAQTKRINRSIDPASRTVLAGTVHPNAIANTATGRAAADLLMDRMQLVLKRSDAQQSALEDLLAAQQDPNSPQYRQFLTPEQFGAQFGASDEDIATLTDWLTQQGFTVAEVAAGRSSIEFSGTVAQVEQAFATEIHTYTENGVEHIANAMEISIPDALADVVSGVASLHDFQTNVLHRTSPQTNLTSGGHALSPYDFATIYNVAPLWKAGTDGTGQTVAIVGRTNINMSDVTTFRSKYGLTGNNTQVILNGNDPGVISSSEATEALLDVEWSGAVARNAAIAFVVSGSTRATGGDVLSSQYIVNHNVAPVMSYSFGLCESQMGATQLDLFNKLWQQAAAQGISVVVAAGDSGSAGCDSPSSTGRSGANTTKPASLGFAVSGTASTAYNVAVGGTQFNEGTSASTYWAASNDSNGASALSYIPEVVWNESSYTTSGASSNGLWAGAGGFSSVYATPSWQTGVGVPSVDPGTTAGHHRYLPDVALSGAEHDAYIIVQNGQTVGVGGTSAGAPAFAGILALANQQAKGPTGNAAPVLYSVAAKVPTAFHDITTGTNAVPCVTGSPNCTTASGATVGTMAGFTAGPGYDLATGLGSVDAYTLVTNWPASTGVKLPAPVISSLTPNPIPASASSQTLTLVGTGFQSGAKIVLTPSTGSATTLTATFVSSLQLTAAVTVGAVATSYTVLVTNPDGQSSATSTLKVVVPPTITSLSPNPITGSNQAQTVTINGTGFVSGAKLNIGNNSVTATYVSAAKLTASVSVGTQTRSLNVSVTNPDGGVSNITALQVNAAAVALTITSLSPNPMTGSASAQTLTINGTGFVTGAKVSLTAPGASPVVYDANFVSSTRLTASVTVGTTAQNWTVSVSNPTGSPSSNSTLQVIAPGTAAVPTVTSINPTSVTGSTRQQFLTVRGTGFSNSSKVVLTPASGSALTYSGFPQVTVIDSTYLLVLVDVGTTAQTWAVTVVNSAGQSSNAATLTVTAPTTTSTAMAITSVSPNPFPASTAAQTMTVTGTGFRTGLHLELFASASVDGASITSVNVVSSTQVQIVMTLGKTAQTWTMQFTNGGTSSNQIKFTVQ